MFSAEIPPALHRNTLIFLKNVTRFFRAGKNCPASVYGASDDANLPSFRRARLLFVPEDGQGN
jgi:hypothetical protein